MTVQAHGSSRSRSSGTGERRGTGDTGSFGAARHRSRFDDGNGSDNNQIERAASALLGGALIAFGLGRRSLGGVALAAVGGELLYRGVSGHSHLSGSQLSQVFGKGSLERIKSELLPTGADAPEIDRAITIGKPAEELYRLWTDPKTLSRIVPDMVEVTDQGQGRKQWAVQGPNGRRICWNTRVVDDKPGNLLRWRSEEGAAIPNEGVVRFSPAPGDRGTEVRLHLRFDPPTGVFGGTMARMLGFGPDLLAAKMLRNLKSLAEAGEIPTTRPQPAAREDKD